MEFLKHVKQEEVLKWVTEMVSIEGHKVCDARESKVAAFIANLFDENGVPSELSPVEEKRPNVFGTLKGEGNGIELMFNGHTDTIPGFTMDYPPFEPFVKDGKLYGRGSVDMKGALTAMISAMIAVKRSGIPIKKTVMFAGVIDEEERSKGTEALIKNGVHPKHVVVGEATNLDVSITHKGMEWVEVKFKGKATHGSRPDEGVNAIYAAGLFADLVRKELEPEINKRTYPLLGHGTINIGKIKGGDDPNIVPDTCAVEIDRRWLPNETLEEVHNEIRLVAEKAAAEIGAKVEVRAMRELTASMINAPYAIEAEDDFVKVMHQIAQEVTKETKDINAFPAWSDAGLLSPHVKSKCIVLGPGSIVQAHANDEFCEIDQILKATEIYYQLILKLCS